MEIIEIWQPVDMGLDGEHLIPEYYDNEEEAKKRCNGFGVAPGPKKHLGLAIYTPEGKTKKVYLFASSDPIPIFHTTDEMKKERALAKLTEEERKLLGHG